MKAAPLSLLLFFLLAPLTGVGSAQDIEDRLGTVETRLDSLIRAQGGAAGYVGTAGYETLSLPPNLEHGIAGRTGRILDKGLFIINYSEDYRIPLWVAYRLDRDPKRGRIDRFGSFREDQKLDEIARSKNSDYTHSGFDRGHMAPAEAFSQDSMSMRATFVYSNAVPQNLSLNRGKWAGLEKDVTEIVSQRKGAWVVTGSAFVREDSVPQSPRRWIGVDNSSRVAVPSHLYKALLIEEENGSLDAWAVLIPNEKPPASATISDYLVTVDKLEQVTGLDFFPGLEDSPEEALESKDHVDWPW